MIFNTIRNEFRIHYKNSLYSHLKELQTRAFTSKMSADRKSVTAAELLDKLASSAAAADGRTPPKKTDSEPAKVKVKAPKASPPQLRHQRQHQAVKKKNVPFIPGTVNLQVIGSGANGSPCSVYLFTDHSRYLFNCGEGTQRLAHEHKTKLARLEQIFMTRNTWSMIGGFPGVALTLQDTGVRQLSVHGPPNLDNILHSMKRFVILKALQVTTRDCTQMQEFEDAVMSVKCVPLYKDTKKEMEESRDDVVIAYICKLKPRPGSLNLEKCVEHGVPPGPLLGLLKNGMDVTLDNGKVVRSHDVSEPGEKALSFIFLDIPDEEYLPALQANNEQFRQLEEPIALVVHFSPANILENNRFKEFTDNFPPQTQHIYLNSSQKSFSGYAASHRIQYQLNQLHPRMFPLLREASDVCGNANISSKLKKTKLSENDKETRNDNETNGDPDERQPNGAINSLTNFHLRPYKGLDRSVEAKLLPEEYVNETRALPDFVMELEKLKTELSALGFDDRQREAFPKIIFLGTGSCIPNKARNVSAILVQPAPMSYMLLDCGEGTLGQIERFYGKKQAEHVMRHLKAIYISHLHADHHIGLIGLLNERQRLGLTTDDKVLLLAPYQIRSWLDFYDQSIEGINDTYEFVGNGEMLDQPLTLADTHKDMGVASISTCLVRHCPHSFGVSLTLTATASSSSDEELGKPIKITYSGDTMPCDDLVDLGRHSTILIHEATMEDDLIEEAKFKMHSTISQAIDQGHAMEAEHIILTHFSQRYAKLPRMQNIGQEAEASAMRNVSIAFDNMHVTLDDLRQFHVLYPALRALFAEHAEELEQKAIKREQRLERKRKLLEADAN